MDLDQRAQEALTRSNGYLRSVDFDQMSAEDKALLYAELFEKHLVDCADIARHVIPPVFKHALPLLSDVAHWVEDFMAGDDALGDRHSLALVGRPGCGKTHAAWQVIKEILGRGHDKFTYKKAAKLLAELQPRSGSTSSDEERIAELVDIDLLVIDDLGAHKLTEWREEKIQQIVDGRWEKRHPLIITTNIPAARFSEHFGGRTGSRLGGMCRAVVFPNIDWRTFICHGCGQHGGVHKAGCKEVA
jgi:hypothetical protein